MKRTANVDKRKMIIREIKQGKIMKKNGKKRK